MWVLNSMEFLDDIFVGTLDMWWTEDARSLPADLKKTLAVLLDNIMLRLGKLESKLENIYNGTGNNLTNGTGTVSPSSGNPEKVNVAGLCWIIIIFCLSVCLEMAGVVWPWTVVLKSLHTLAGFYLGHLSENMNNTKPFFHSWLVVGWRHLLRNNRVCLLYIIMTTGNTQMTLINNLHTLEVLA